MLNTVTVAGMKEIERKADEAGLSYYEMMENAGSMSYRTLLSEYPLVDSLIIFCGKGNNGGDGLVVARLAANDGKKVRVILAEGDPATRDAISNLNRLPKEVDVIRVENLITRVENLITKEEIDGSKEIEITKEILNAINPEEKMETGVRGLGNSVIIDALYGTGFHGELRKMGKLACDIMNSIPAPVVALDIPSGCNADDGTVAEGAVKADITIAFHAYKNIHLKSIVNCGRCELVSIGIEGIY